MVIRVWDLATGEVRVLDPGERKRPSGLLFLPNGQLLSGSQGGLRLWNIQDGTSRLLRTEEVALTYYRSLLLLPDGRSVRCVLARPARPEGAEQVIWDWQSDTWRHFVWGSRDINLQGTRYFFSQNGVLYVGRVTRGRPDGAESVLEPAQPAGLLDNWSTIEFSPDGNTIAGGSGDGSLRIVEVPEGRPMLETLPRREFLARMYAAINARAVRDKQGYRFETTPFPGWKTMPEW
jgi:WD40 repeat protein